MCDPATRSDDLDDRTDLAELLELLNTFAQDDGAPDPVQAADTAQATNPVHEEHQQTLLEDNEHQTEPDDPFDVEQNAASNRRASTIPTATTDLQPTSFEEWLKCGRACEMKGD